MTKEEQQTLRELKKPLDKICRETGKRRGWKTAGKVLYQVQGALLFISARQGGEGLCHTASLRCKSPAADGLFWELTGQRDILTGKPFRFHLRGSPAAACLEVLA